MSTVLGKYKKHTIIAAATLMLTGTCALAADINLSEIEINTSDNNGYNIVLKTDKKTEFKKVMKNDKQLVIEMKNTAASENLSTIYNNAADINNVTVTPSGKDDLKIQIQGKDVNNSIINLDYTGETQAMTQNFDPEQINLNLPIEDYKPIYNENDIENTEETGNVSSLSSLNPVTLAQKITNRENSDTPNNGGFKWLTYLGLAVILITAGKNIFKPAPEAQIGLTQSLKEREKDLAQKLNNGVRETLSLRSKIAQNASAPSINYGLRSYQNSQRNPYESAPVSTFRTTKNIQTPPQVKPQTRITASTSTIPAMPRSERTMSSPIQRKQALNVDSMKFLESMTKIYEKNGRTDLAAGLKNNIRKVNV